MRIIEAYQVPTGNVSPDIFALPCVVGAMKDKDNGIIYYVETAFAYPDDYICKYANGEWLVLSPIEYQAEKGDRAMNCKN